MKLLCSSTIGMLRLHQIGSVDLYLVVVLGMCAGPAHGQGQHRKRQKAPMHQAWLENAAQRYLVLSRQDLTKLTCSGDSSNDGETDSMFPCEASTQPAKFYNDSHQIPLAEHEFDVSAQ